MRQGGRASRRRASRRRWWFSWGYVLGLAMAIVLLIWLVLAILPDPLAH